MIRKLFIPVLLFGAMNIYCQANPSVNNTSTEKEFFNIVLGRPTDKSITASLLPSKNMSIYCEYKKSTESIYSKTTAQNVTKDVPYELVLTNLTSNTKYNYHIVYGDTPTSGYVIGDEHSFQTQRAKGSTFSFTLEADPHPYDKKGSHTLWDICFNNQLNDSPDFMIDLGDTFGDDHTPSTTTSDDMKQLHLDNRSHFGIAAHSVPLFFCLGNHEGESGYYLLQTPPNNIGVYGTLWRKYYYPNPEPNDFYSGNTNLEQFGMGLPQNYYAWEWGDALFVVVDAYRGYTANSKPRGWEWTLGQTQFSWLEQTLKNSSAKYKFVLTHHILGETRGGLAVAKNYEWGGYEANNTTYSFTANRPGWSMPIHQLMVKYGVNIFFQGHDHLYAKEEMDGIVYQEVPMPSDSTYIIGMTDNGSAYGGIKLDASGHLRVTVNPNEIKVDYVRAWLPKDETSQHKNGEVAYSYSVLPKTTDVKIQEAVPTEYTLMQNYPNPFNPETVISYQLPQSGFVSLKVFDVLGREVATLVDEYQNAGTYNSKFIAQNYNVPSGVYFYRLNAGNFVQTKKALLIK